MKYIIHVKRTQFLEAEIEADSIDDAREIAQSGRADFHNSNCGRGLGDDDYIVTDIQAVEESDLD